MELLTERPFKPMYNPKHLHVRIISIALFIMCVACSEDHQGVPEPTEDGGLPVPDTLPPPEEPECDSGMTFCDGFCANLDDSTEHCGACHNDCRNLPNADPQATTCAEGSCTLVCQSRYGNCDGETSNGCEVSLMEAEHCGDCDTACENPTPLCEASETPQCIDTCTSPTGDLCGSSCTNLQSDAAHCGDCETACSIPQNGSAQCQAGSCGIACFSGYHACGTPAQCLSNTSVASCGTRCTPCAVPANGYATCDGTDCGFACYQGYVKVGTKCEPLWQNVPLRAPTGLTGVYTEITALHGRDVSKGDVLVGATFRQTNNTSRYFIVSAVSGRPSAWLDSPAYALFVLPRDKYDIQWTWAGFQNDKLGLYQWGAPHGQWTLNAGNAWGTIRSIWASSDYNSYVVGDTVDPNRGILWHPNQSDDACEWTYSVVASETDNSGGFSTIREDRQGGFFLEHNSLVYASPDRDGPWTKGAKACSLPNNKLCWSTSSLEVNTDGALIIVGFELRDTQPYFRSYVWRSTNRGATWITLWQVDDVVLNAVAAAGQHLFAGGRGWNDNMLFHSSNGGATWTNESPTISQLNNYRYEATHMWTDANKTVYVAGQKKLLSAPSTPDEAFIWRRRSW